MEGGVYQYPLLNVEHNHSNIEIIYKTFIIHKQADLILLVFEQRPKAHCLSSVALNVKIMISHKIIRLHCFTITVCLGDLFLVRVYVYDVGRIVFPRALKDMTLY